MSDWKPPQAADGTQMDLVTELVDTEEQSGASGEYEEDDSDYLTSGSDGGGQDLLGDELAKAPIWLVTFGDVTALILAFFVMLYSMSYIQSEKWEAIVSILTTSLDPTQDVDPRPVGEQTVTRLVLVEAFPTGYLERILTKKLKEDPVLSDVTVSGLDGRLILSLSSDVIFEGSNADLSEAGREMIANLSTIFGQFGNQVDVQGHTAPLPIPEDSKYNNRSALTLGRALAVAKYLRVNGFHGDPTVTGLAESGYKHIDQSIPEAVRFALAQRVDLVILPEARGQ